MLQQAVTFVEPLYANRVLSSGTALLTHALKVAATLAAVENGGRGVYNVVDDDPAPVAEWLPELAAMLAKTPMRVPRFIGRLAAGQAGVVLMTELRGASNAKAKRELGWHPAHASWRQGLQAKQLR